MRRNCINSRRCELRIHIYGWIKAKGVGRRTDVGMDGICRNVDGRDAQVAAHIPVGDLGNS